MTAKELKWSKYSSDQLEAATQGTYGIGVNPEAVRELLQATKILLGQFEKESVSESNIIAINRARAAIKKATL